MLGSHMKPKITFNIDTIDIYLKPNSLECNASIFSHQEQNETFLLQEKVFQILSHGGLEYSSEVDFIPAPVLIKDQY